MNKAATILVCLMPTLSCNKSSDDNNWEFSWMHKNNSHTASDANAYISQINLDKGPTYIAARIATLTRDYKISIYLTSLNPSSYLVSLSTSKVRYIYDPGYELAGAAGSVT